jgi:DNA-binding response OmpR family regulator
MGLTSPGGTLRVLVVEDELKMAELLERALREQKCSVETAYTGMDGLRMARDSLFDVITLDVMLPGMDGIEVARELRRVKVLSPILFLTARDSKIDVVRALDAGGDDYLTKPFSFLELLARLRALTRRGAVAPSRKLHVDDLVLDAAKLEVTRGGIPVELSRTEFLLLEVLMRKAGSVVLRQVLFDAVWGAGHSVESNTLDVFIRLLRRKIDYGRSIKLIQTVRGFGYMLQSQPSL